MTHPALDAHLLNLFQNNSPLFQNIPGAFNIKTHKVFHTCFRCWNGCLHKHGKKLRIMKSAKHGLRYLKQNTGNMPKWIYVAFFSRWKPSRPFNLNFWFRIVGQNFAGELKLIFAQMVLGCGHVAGWHLFVGYEILRNNLRSCWINIRGNTSIQSCVQNWNKWFEKGTRMKSTLYIEYSSHWVPVVWDSNRGYP